MPTRRDLLAITSGAVVGAATAGVAAPAAAHAPNAGVHAWSAGWVATWAAAPTTIPPTPPTVLERQTVRHVVHCSAGGGELRIRLTNEFGETPLHVGTVHVALRSGTGASTATVAGSDRRGPLRRPRGAPL